MSRILEALLCFAAGFAIGLFGIKALMWIAIVCAAGAAAVLLLIVYVVWSLERDIRKGRE